MRVLTAILTHLDAPTIERQLGYLHALAPGSRFVVCHGGKRADFDELDAADAVFIDHPSLRGGLYAQSFNEVLVAVYEGYVRDDPTIELLFVIEFDHLILRPDFERSLSELAERSGAGLIAKGTSVRNDTNWAHYVRYLEDRELERFFARVSRRDDAAVRWGCLGNGMLLRRAALRAFCELGDLPPRYVELFVPSLVYHLGFDVANADALGDLYMAVRWRPEYTLDDALAAARSGRTFVHPFKRLDRLDDVRAAAPAPASAS